MTFRTTVFTRTAPVGNSKNHLNPRELAADDSLSLPENDFLLTPSLPFSILLIYPVPATVTKYLDIVIRLAAHRNKSIAILVTFCRLVKPSEQKFIHRSKIAINMGADQ